MTIAAAFDGARARGETALLPYVMGGFPDLERSVEILHEVDAAGADLIELGVPFSDPVADGPAIQHAAHVALEAGASLAAILAAVVRRPPRAPFVLMSYVNPLLALGLPDAAGRLRDAGAAGLIVPDLPVEESAPWRDALAASGLDLVPLAAPTSGASRLRTILDGARGFLYYVSVTGTTGTRDSLDPRLVPALDALRARADVPVAVGFGISTAAHVHALRDHADGVVVGSRLVRAIADGESVGRCVEELKEATRRG